MAVASSFLSYLLLFVILVVIAIAGGAIGVRLAKNKNAKMAAEADIEKTEE